MGPGGEEHKRAGGVTEVGLLLSDGKTIRAVSRGGFLWLLQGMEEARMPGRRHKVAQGHIRLCKCKVAGFKNI